MRLAAAAAAVLWAAPASAGSAQTTIGQTQLSNGEFGKAQESFESALRAHPGEADALVGLAAVQFYENSLDAALRNVTLALQQAPKNSAALELRDAIRRRKGAPGQYVLSFAHGDSAGVAFHARDPVTTISVRINGSRDAIFAIDSTAPAVVISNDLADRLAIRRSAQNPGEPGEGVLAEITIGGLDVRGVPVMILPPRPPQSATPDIDGVIGAGFLAHTLTTIDYPNARLIFRSPSSSAAFEREAKAGHAGFGEMWFAGDRDIFASARVNRAPTGLFGIETAARDHGLFVTPQTIVQAHITYDRTKIGQNHDNTGIRFLPFNADLSLGSLTIHNVPGTMQPTGFGPGSSLPFYAAGAIGEEAFDGCAVTFDFTAMKLVVQRR